jgi:transcriptional regulator with XRE-family HTH domain
MPRRSTPDPTARAVGQRIRQLRGERQLTAERLAFESELGSKGFLSDIEQGRASPSIQTLQVIADYLEVLLVDLFTFPERSEREQLIDRTRWLTAGTTRKLLRELPRPKAVLGAATSSGRSPGPAKSKGYASATGASSKKLDVAETTSPNEIRRKKRPAGPR